MKHLVYTLLVLFVLSSCDDDNEFIANIDHTITVNYNANYDGQAASGVAIELTNTEDNKVYDAQTDNTGSAALSLTPGVYNITATKTFTPAEFLAFSGQNVTSNVVFNASLQNVTINGSSSATTLLEIVSGRIGDVIIKQIYYAGSDVVDGALFRDQFFEVHNNSNETIYLDGLCFAQLSGTSSVPSTIEDYHLSNGQYDWSKSIGNTKGAAANTDYSYSEEVIRIPGTGTTYPLESGKSAIIAATAVNHKAPLTVTDFFGDPYTYEIPNPDLTVDLSSAPFEAYFRPYQESVGNGWLDSDVDNPSAANLEVVFKTAGGKDLILDPFGRDAYAIFYATDADIASWSSLPLPNATAVDASTRLYLQIPNDVIVDGVELQNVDPSRAKPKRLSSAIDGGEIAGIKGGYTSEAVIRKVSTTVDDRTFYKDTNNSSEDFEVIAHPQVD